MQPPHSNTTPIQILLLRDHNNSETDRYFQTLCLAFEGAGASEMGADSYLNGALDLQIQVLDPNGFGIDGFSLQRLLRAARHTVTVILEPLPEDAEFRKRLDQLKDTLAPEEWFEERIPDPVADEQKQLYSIRPGEIEKGLHPVAVALKAMERARRLLQQDLNRRNSKKPADDRLRFFLSHAKMDGIPLALSLVGLMRRFAGALAENDQAAFDTFYDAEDIHAGQRWRETLETNASHSVLIVLYTEEYENRYWCRQEYLWAERNRVPILLVELRTGLFHDGARLPLAPAPRVRVHDGNLIRVVFQAMAAHLRILTLEQRIHSGRYSPIPRTTLPRHPSLLSLQAALEDLKPRLPASGGKGEIVYPNPRLNQAELDALDTLLNGEWAGVRLITPDELDSRSPTAGDRP